MSINFLTLSKFWPYIWNIASIFLSEVSNSNNCGDDKNLINKLDLNLSIESEIEFNLSIYILNSTPLINGWYKSWLIGQLISMSTNSFCTLSSWIVNLALYNGFVSLFNKTLSKSFKLLKKISMIDSLGFIKKLKS